MRACVNICLYTAAARATVITAVATVVVIQAKNRYNSETANHSNKCYSIV